MLIMPFIWTVVINVAILFAMNKYKRVALIIHSAIGLFVALVTLILSIPLLIDHGIFNSGLDYILKVHIKIGLAIIIIIFAQVLSGMVTSLSKVFFKEANPYVIFFSKIFHVLVGYALTILSKIQTYMFLYQKEDYKLFWILLGFEIFFLIAWLLQKLFFPVLESVVVPRYENLQVQRVKNVSEVKTLSANLGVFANYVYDLTPLETYHPLGFRIIESIKNREFDRYIYGMYSTERAPLIVPHSHSLKAFDLLDNPIAKISIPSLYEGLEENHNIF